MAKILITGIAGFIGASVGRRLAQSGHQVVGVDNLNTYYDPNLKRARINWVREAGDLAFHETDIADYDTFGNCEDVRDCDVVIHLAAQAGVRYSLENPFAYAKSNLMGHLSVLELVRHCSPSPRLVYASSSSVYGSNTETPFSETAAVDAPVSLYAATKRADELMSAAYSRLYNIEQIGLRFFTVYGPWGRPDMAYWSFTQKILSGEPIPVFNEGQLQRDFTYIDDVVDGVIATALNPFKGTSDIPHEIYNIGNNRSVPLLSFINELENALGKKAKMDLLPMQPGDVLTTYADIDALARDYGFEPKTPLNVGIERFVSWYQDYVQSD